MKQKTMIVVTDFFLLILCLSTMTSVDSLVRLSLSSSSSFQVPPLPKLHRMNQHKIFSVNDGEDIGQERRKLPVVAHPPPTGHERREVLALLGFTIGWSTSRMTPNGASWMRARALDDTETLTSDSSVSTFPQPNSSDNAAKSRTIDITWDTTDEQGRFNIDSVNSQGTSTGSKINVSYQLPQRWKTNTNNDFDNNYLDVEKQAKACNHITVYQAPLLPIVDGQYYKSMETLQKSMDRIGVAKALQVPEWLSEAIQSADLLSARKETKRQTNDDDGTEQMYLELEMASAPSNCNSVASNKDDKLGLGLFCPYDTIYLLSATLVDSRLYVLVAEASSDQWKRSNGDLKFVRSSFSVESQ